VIAAQGPDVSMSAIAADIGLTKPVVYRSLGDKAQLSAALGGRVADRLAGELRAVLGGSGSGSSPGSGAGSGSLREVVAAAIDVFCRFVDDETNLYRFVVHGSIGTRHTGLPEKSLVARLGGEISGALHGALARADADADPALADTWAYAILGAVFAATEHWLRHRHIPRATLVAHLVDLITPALHHTGLTPTPSALPSTTPSTPL
jgi:AcrR family transcriptional regulator